MRFEQYPYTGDVPRFFLLFLYAHMRTSVLGMKGGISMIQSIKSASGKLLGKWDDKNRVLQIQRKKEITYIKISAEGVLEISPTPPDNLTENTMN